MQGRKGSKKTIMDMMRADGYDPTKKQRVAVEDSLQGSTITDEEIKAIREYNTNILTIDPDYANLKMIGDILVRCFLYEPNVSESGLYEPFKTQVSVKTQSGMDSLRDVENDYHYSLKAIIVSCPENYTAIKTGDIIQMKQGAIKDSAVGDLKNGFFLRIHNAFSRVTDHPPVTPKDKTSKDYGYLTINYNEIQCLLPQ